MGHAVVFPAPRRVELTTYPERDLAPHEVRLRTLYSGISAGTELTAYRGTNPYLSKSWDAERRLFVGEAGAWSYPVMGFGYEEVGEVAEVGAAVTQLRPGEVVWGVWGHRSTHVADEGWAAARRLPEGLSPVCGIFSQIGSIALNAVLDAEVNVGECAAVFGQGVPGLITTQLLKASGAEVVAVDALPGRLETARVCGADHRVNAAETSAAEVVKDLTGGRGADVVIEFTGHYGALHEAVRTAAYNARVVVSGFFQGDGQGLRLGEEFHHNRVQMVCSQISGVNPRLTGRWDRLRLDQTVMRLQARRQLDLGCLVSHTFPVADAAQAFALLDTRPAEALQVVLEF